MTLERLKQTMNTKFEEVYDYLDKIKKASLDEGGVINGDLDINGNITKDKVNVLTEAGGIIDSPFYDKGNIKRLPAGNDDLDYWKNLPNGRYWYNNTGSPANMPYTYGFVEKIQINKNDFSIEFFQQTKGLIYRKSGNSSVISNWYIPHRSVMVGITTRQIFSFTSWMWKILPINNIESGTSVYNDELIFADSGIKIGKNVHKVKVNAFCQGFYTLGFSGDRNFGVSINGSDIGYPSYVTIPTSAGLIWFPMSTSIASINVNEGDIIKPIFICGATSDTEILGIRTTVEVID